MVERAAPALVVVVENGCGKKRVRVKTQRRENT
jgi:hypothetical protein